jgi:2-haloacid dehalogenase
VTLIVFDIGNVLLRWEPRAAVRDVVGSAGEIGALLNEAGCSDCNHANDGGRARAGAVAEIKARWSAHVAVMDGYFDRFPLTIRDRIAGSWDVLRDLRAAGHRARARTNFAAQTWPDALRPHPGLGEVFEGIVVSGREGVVKPERAIFDPLCARAGVAPGACFVIDHSAAKVAGARAAGWQAHRFKGADGLRAGSRDRGLL